MNGESIASQELRGHVKKECVVGWNKLEKLQEGEKQKGATEFCKGESIRGSASTASRRSSGTGTAQKQDCRVGW